MALSRSEFMTQWTPRLFQQLYLRQYNRKDFLADVIAGVTVGLVALPLAMAFAIASGVKPEQGIYTAIVAGIIISAFGGSRVQIGGPTGAFVIIVAGIIAQFGLSGLWMVTAMAGVILLLMGITGLGTMIKYIPRPIVIGFTNGIALLIASTQIKDFLGLKLVSVPSEFIPRMIVLLGQLDTVQWQTLAISLFSLGLILLWPRLTTRVPAYIVALLFGTLAVVLFHLPVETIGTRFGGIPTGLPAFRMPDIAPQMILPLLPSALTVALLSAIESLLSAVVSDGMIGDRHNSNVELMANGLANLMIPMVSGIPATGAIARTATNVRSGARSPVAGIIHSLTLLIILLVAAPLASFVPLATLAAILFVVAYRMGEWHEIKTVLRLSRADIIVWIVTFLLTVLANLTLAVEIGMVLAAMLYIYRVSRTTAVMNITSDYLDSMQHHTLVNRDIPEHVSIIQIQGPFLFGCTDKLTEITADLTVLNPVVILRLRDMTAIDATGLHAIETLAKRLKASGRVLLLCGANAQPALMLSRSTVVHLIGHDNVLPHFSSALLRAEAVYTGMA